MDGWQPPRSIPWDLRRRARRALRGYTLAEDQFQSIQDERDALEERMRILLKRWAKLHSLAPLPPEASAQVEMEVFSICVRLQDLLLPWQTAHIALISAYEEVQAVLRAGGFTARLDS